MDSLSFLYSNQAVVVLVVFQQALTPVIGINSGFPFKLQSPASRWRPAVLLGSGVKGELLCFHIHGITA